MLYMIRLCALRNSGTCKLILGCVFEIFSEYLVSKYKKKILQMLWHLQYTWIRYVFGHCRIWK